MRVRRSIVYPALIVGLISAYVLTRCSINSYYNQIRAAEEVEASFDLRYHHILKSMAEENASEEPERNPTELEQIVRPPKPRGPI